MLPAPIEKPVTPVLDHVCANLDLIVVVPHGGLPEMSIVSEPEYMFIEPVPCQGNTPILLLEPDAVVRPVRRFVSTLQPMARSG